ncbi:MAG TPA: NAD(P)/FAD-dependent oxidoreductase [Chloroflexota bacterium]|nr:NAD(P)/FAD-dependent oxidoreductase [Chloroflexota bacterium]
MKAIVVGAGLAGLVAARTLHRARWEVVVLEASDGIGGRVRTDVVADFRLDRGFQMLFTGYPAVQRQLDLKALKLRVFDAGAIVVEGGRWHELGDPRKDLKALLPTLVSAAGLSSDKLALFRLLRQPAAEPEEMSTAELLRVRGFSERFIDLFFRGMFGSLYLDRSLAMSSACFLSDIRALSQGRAAVPRDGMQAIPDQIARDLPQEAIRLGTPALRLERSGGKVIGVQTSNETLEADAVILAAHSPEVERLSGIEMPKEAHSATCLYFHLPYPLYGHKKVVVNGYPNGFVSLAVQISNVASSYAPQAEHLLAATIIGAPDLSLEQLTKQALEDMQRWFPWRSIQSLNALAAYQVPFARLSQPPGFRAALPSNRTGTPGLYLAGEYTEWSSIEGALTSGERAADEVLRTEY